ncbi:hypothetical protein BGZ91_008929, partial [Linnemannia elongata]
PAGSMMTMSHSIQAPSQSSATESTMRRGRDMKSSNNGSMIGRTSIIRLPCPRPDANQLTR